MKGQDHIFYTPENQYPDMPHGEMCGDIMPFYWEGRYLLFFLYKYCIYVVETPDFVTYGGCRLVLQNGSPDEQDWHAATGSVFHHAGIFYFYYTGFCEGNRGVRGQHEQAILRATSKDLLNWEKEEGFRLTPDERYFGPLHFRDPHVFWNEERKKFCMLITATTKEGACLRNGCTAVYTSDNMEDWNYDGISYAPGIFPTHECQDLFQMGECWYLTFSTYRRQWETRYRFAETSSGPWMTPAKDDLFDGRQFYAAKTVTDGKERYLVGWQSIRKGCTDEGRLVWGGNVVVHRLIQRADQTLGAAMPQTIRDSFQKSVPVTITPVSGEWEQKEALKGSCEYGFGWALAGMTEGTVLFESTVTWRSGTQAVGVMLRTSGRELEKWCQIRLEPERGKLLADRYNRIDGDQSFEEERAISLKDNTAHIQIITSGSILQVYVDDVALTTRCYGVQDGGIGVFVECGQADFTGIKLLAGGE